MTTGQPAYRARSLVDARVVPAAGSLLGIEHEYTLHDDAGAIDFRPLVHGLAIAGRRLDPGDANAYRCSFGGVITCDGPEAEVATPPVAARPGFTLVVDAWARTARAELERVLPPGVHADGYSTHLNAALSTRRGDRVARRYARTFGAGLMLLLDGRASPGLLVRPRPGRLELGGEYVTGPWLRAATAFAAGSTRAAVARHLPAHLDVAIEAGVERYGWFVDRRAFGVDLYRHGRTTRLRRGRGGTITAQEHLEASWELARAALDGVAGEADLRDADRIVAGDFPLPLEALGPLDDVLPPVALDATSAEVLVLRSRPRFSVEAAIATWDFTVFALRASARTGYLCIPRDRMARFFAELDAGALDHQVEMFLGSPTRDRVLASVGQTHEPGFYDRLGPPSGLLPRERDPATGRPVGGGGATGDRPGKRETHEQPRPRGRRLAAAAVAAVLVALVAIAAAVVAGGGGDGDRDEVEVARSRRAAVGVGTPRETVADFEPNGSTEGTIAYRQDGTYQVQQHITVAPANVRPGDTVEVATSTTSIGPNWGRTPTGEFQLGCDAANSSDFTPSSSSTVYLTPASGSGTALVGGISSGGTPSGAVGATARLVGGEFREVPQGCDRTASADNVASLIVPLTIRPGRYAVVPTWGLFAELPGQRNELVYTGGSYPALTVVRPR